MFKKCLPCLSALALFAPAAHANLLTNGSFEQPTIYGTAQFLNPGSTAITGWTVFGNQVQWNVSNAYPYVTSSDGNQMLDLTGVVGQGGGVASDLITTSIGSQYRLSFDLGSFMFSNGSYGTAAVDVTLNGVSFGRFIQPVNTATPGTQWATQTLVFTASTNSLVIGISSSVGAAYSSLGVGLDNVVLDAVDGTSVPEPSTWSLFAAALGLVGLASRVRRRGMSRLPAAR